MKKTKTAEPAAKLMAAPHKVAPYTPAPPAGAQFGVPCAEGRHQVLVERLDPRINPVDRIALMQLQGYTIDKTIADSIYIMSIEQEKFDARVKEAEDAAARARRTRSKEELREISESRSIAGQLTQESHEQREATLGELSGLPG